MTEGVVIESVVAADRSRTTTVPIITTLVWTDALGTLAVHTDAARPEWTFECVARIAAV